MMRAGWSGEIVRLVLLLFAALVLGLLLGYPRWLLIAALLAYLGRHLYWLYRLQEWLEDGRAVPPEASGVWDEIFTRLYRRYRSNQQRKRRIARLIRAFRNSSAAMPDGVVALNRTSQIEWFNDAAARLLGLSRQQDSGQRIDNLVRTPVFIRYLKERRFDEPLEIASPVDDARRVTLQVVPYGEGEQLLLVRDVTRLVRLEQSRREFVANASHELRSPLTVISGYLEALGEDDNVAREWATPLREMRRQAERMTDIVGDLLELSRLETTTRPADGEVIDVPGLLARIREEALALGEGPRKVEVHIETDARLRGIEREIYSAFSNIVFNAMRYTKAEGEVSIRWYDDEGRPCLDVSDTGIGIAAEHIPRLTERFYRVDSGRVRSQGGTGLGLAIVKHVMQHHGGRLRIVSTPGRGSTFTCIFPVERRAA